ncbi:hypothetical protein IFR05_011372 [Cadophora sp. M221]|nr:hypothetical protein IFR05_011372 [Cadophora sp. M221]
MISGQFKEATLRNVDLPEDELPIISAMLRYLYTNDYDDNPEATASVVANSSPPQFSLHFGSDSEVETPAKVPGITVGGESLVFNVKMYVVADKYDIPGLKCLAKKKFEKAVKLFWNSTGFSEAAKFLWENTVEWDRDLRDVVIKSAASNIETLLDRGEFVELMDTRGDVCRRILRLTLDSKLAEGVIKSPIVEDYSWGSAISSSTKKKTKYR